MVDPVVQQGTLFGARFHPDSKVLYLCANSSGVRRDEPVDGAPLRVKVKSANLIAIAHAASRDGIHSLFQFRSVEMGALPSRIHPITRPHASLSRRCPGLDCVPHEM